MARVKVFDKDTNKWVYADRSFGRIPVRGVDYYTEEDKVEFENFIATELAKRGQLAPEFANSVKQCTDTTKLYVLPDGYIYAYTQYGGYTNLVPTSVDYDDTVYNGTGYKDNCILDRSNSTVSITEQSGYVTTGFIPITSVDIIRMYGVEWIKENTSIIAFYDVDKKPLGRYIGNGFVESPDPEYFDGVHKVTCLGDKTTQSVTTENGESTFNITYTANEHITQNPDAVVPGSTVVVGAYKVKYMRISAQGSGADMIVTLNEKIYGNEPSGYAWRNTGHAFVPADYEDRINALEENMDNLDSTIQEALEDFSNTDNFDATEYGLPVLRVTGNAELMTADKNAVDFEYVYGNLSGSCTMKWQGSSSIKWEKKNYTIKFDNAFEAYEGWGEQKKYCLKANYIDFSHARNLVNAKLWGQVVKSRKNANTALNALVNGGAVDGFPICMFINDVYQGIYTFNIPKDGWMFGMGDGTNEAIVCAGGRGEEVVTFREADTVLDDDFDLEYAPDEDNTAWIKTSLDRMISACINSDGTDLDTTVAQYLDWDSAIDYIIFAVLINGFDCLTKNYLLATYDGTKWFFSAYDMDCTYGLHWAGTTFFRVNEAYNNRASIGEFCRIHRAFELVKLYKKDALKSRYAKLRADILSEDNVATVFANFIGSIPKALYDKECTIWKEIPNTATNNLHQITDFYRRKCAVIDAEIEAL